MIVISSAHLEAVRNVPPTPDEHPFPPVGGRVVDEEAEAVRNVPPTPDERVLESDSVRGEVRLRPSMSEPAVSVKICSHLPPAL